MIQNKTVEVPIRWFEGLLECLDAYQQAEDSVAQDTALSKLEGYISSAEAIVKLGDTHGTK